MEVKMPQPNEGEDASAKRRQRSCCSWQALPPNEGAEVAKTRTHDINKAAGRNILNTEHGTRIFTGGGLGKLLSGGLAREGLFEKRPCDS